MTGTKSDHHHPQPIHQYINLLVKQNDDSSNNTTTIINSSPSYIRTIINKAMSDPKVFTGFTELSSLPSLKEILNESSTNGQSLLNTLDLFSFGIYNDYYKEMIETGMDGQPDQDQQRKYIKLNDAQEMKLKMLTIVSIVQQTLETMGTSNSSGNSGTSTTNSSSTGRNHRRYQRNRLSSNKNNSDTDTKLNKKYSIIVQYSKLQSALHITNNDGDGNDGNNTTKDNIRKLEDMLIQCIYSNLLPNGTKLDQKHLCMVIHTNSLMATAATNMTSSTGTTNNTEKSSGSGAGSTGANSTTTTTSSSIILCRDINIHKDCTDISSMIHKLQTLYNRNEKIKTYLKQNVNHLYTNIYEDERMWEDVEHKIETTKKMILEKNNRKNGSGRGIDNLLDVIMNDASNSEVEASMAAKRQLKRTRGGRTGRSYS
jgi:hypothetical protein